jgi:hypothetical protein
VPLLAFSKPVLLSSCFKLPGYRSMERITTSDVAHHPLLHIATANSASHRIKNHPFRNTLEVSKKVSKILFCAGSLAAF